MRAQPPSGVELLSVKPKITQNQIGSAAASARCMRIVFFVWYITPKRADDEQVSRRIAEYGANLETRPWRRIFNLKWKPSEGSGSNQRLLVALDCRGGAEAGRLHELCGSRSAGFPHRLGVPQALQEIVRPYRFEAN